MPTTSHTETVGPATDLDRLSTTETGDHHDPRFHHRDGVFYPVGHALLAFPDDESLSRAVDQALTGGIADAELTVLDADQMKEIVQRSQHDAGLLSRIVSAELKQMTILAQLAETGHRFLLVRSRDETRPTLHRMSSDGASKGLLFHLLAVEELPVAKETIPGASPFGMNEVIRTQHSDANVTEPHDEEVPRGDAPSAPRA